MSRRFPTASERALEADLRIDDFRRRLMTAKAPTTHRLLRAVDEAMEGLGHCPAFFELESLSMALAYDAQRGAEHGAASVATVERVIAKAKEARS